MLNERLMSKAGRANRWWNFCVPVNVKKKHGIDFYWVMLLLYAGSKYFATWNVLWMSSHFDNRNLMWKSGRFDIAQIFFVRVFWDICPKIYSRKIIKQFSTENYPWKLVMIFCANIPYITKYLWIKLFQFFSWIIYMELWEHFYTGKCT